MKLGTLLLRNAAISLTQLEAALRAQVIYGGRLGTNLVELGFIDLDQLATYLSELSQLPVATRAHLEGAQPEALAMIDAATAERLGVLPLAITAPPQRSLALAMIEPFDAGAIEELAARTSLPISRYVVPELRLLYYLERAYGLPRKARFVRTGGRRLTPSAYDDRRRSQPPGGIVMPPAVRVQPRKRAASTAPPAAAAVATPASRLAWGVAADQLERAIGRDHIAQTFLDFGAGRFEALVMFLVRDGNALGWHARVGGRRPPTPIEQLSLPLGPASAFQTAHDGMRLFHGPADAAHPVESRLWEVLATPPPLEVIVAPVLVKRRVVNLVYAHAPGGAALADVDIAELAELTIRASDAYVRLIQQSKS